MTASAKIEITVYGRPAPQGSKRAFVIRGGPRKGQAAVIESSHDRVKAWRQAVIDAACEVKAWPMLDGPLLVVIAFWLPRPKSHYGTGRNATTLKPSAPPYPSGTPDLGKLARATEDALTAAAIFHDDALIVRESLSKDYAGPNSLPRPYATGAYIRIHRLA